MCGVTSHVRNISISLLFVIMTYHISHKKNLYKKEQEIIFSKNINTTISFYNVVHVQSPVCTNIAKLLQAACLVLKVLMFIE